jgi:hypothetical protein
MLVLRTFEMHLTAPEAEQTAFGESLHNHH